MGQLKSLLVLAIAYVICASCHNTHEIDQLSLHYSKQVDTLISQKKFEEAKVVVAKALEIDSLNYVALNNRAWISSNYDKDLARAEKDLLTVVQIGPKYEIGRYNLIICKFDQNDFESVLQLSQKYISDFGYRRDIRFKLAESYNLLNQFSKSLPHFDRILTEDPHSAPVYKERSVAHRNLGNTQLALDDALKAVRLDSTYSQAFNNLGIVYMEMRQFAHALNAFNQAIELEPTSHMYYYNRGVLKIDKLSTAADGCRDLLRAINLGSTLASEQFDTKCE